MAAMCFCLLKTFIYLFAMLWMILRRRTCLNSTVYVYYDVCGSVCTCIPDHDNTKQKESTNELKKNHAPNEQSKRKILHTHTTQHPMNRMDSSLYLFHTFLSVFLHLFVFVGQFKFEMVELLPLCFYCCCWWWW